jgi:hypothetical protein
MMMDLIIKIMVELLSVLALATKQIKQGRFSKCAVRRQIYVTYSQCVTEKFVKKLWGKDKILAALERLDRLTKEEVPSAVAQTLGVVHGIADDMRVVMRGAPYFRNFSQISV